VCVREKHRLLEPRISITGNSLKTKIKFNIYYRVFLYPTDAQLDCSKNVKIYIKIYMRGAPLNMLKFTLKFI